MTETTMVHVAFEPGLNDGVDPSLLPPGKLRTVRNARPRRLGRYGKRAGFATQALTTISGTISGKPNALTEWQGRPLLISDCAAWEYQGAKWSSHGVGLARFSPLGSTVVARATTTSGLTTLNPKAPSVAYATTTGRLVYVWDDGTNPYYAVYDDDGGLIKQGAVPVTGTTGKNCRAVAYDGNSIAIAIQHSADIRAIVLDTSTLTFGSDASIGTLSTASSVWDAAAYTTTKWLIAYQNSATGLRIGEVTGATIGTTLTTSTPATTVQGVAVMGTSGENIYLAWITTAGEPFCGVYPTALNGETGVTTLNTGITIGIGQPTIVRKDSTHACVYWTEQDETPNWFATTREATVSNAASAATTGTIAHVRLASRAFTVGTRRFVWCHTDEWWDGSGSTSSGWALQRTCYLLEFATNGCHLHASEYRATQRALDKLPDVAYVSAASTPFYAYPMLEVLLSGLDTGSGLTDELYQVRALQFDAADENQRAATRQTCSDGGAVMIAGGVIGEYTGELYENGFLWYPVVENISAAASGSVDDGAHDYVVVFEWVDALGRRQRSSPSQVATVTTGGGNNKAVLIVSTYWLGRNQIGALELVYMHVYRKPIGLDNYVRVTPNVGVPVTYDPFASAANVTYTDTLSESAISAREDIYTDGSVKPNAIPPASRFICAGGQRIWLGGGFDPTVVNVSKPLVAVEPAQFVNSEEFRIRFQEPLTAIAWGDGALIAWSTTGIYLVGGSGPDDQGSGSFSDPRRLPSDAGCIDHRSIVEVPQGWLYQSQRGIYLLPRGFSTPQPILDVAETIAAYPSMRSAAVVRKSPSSASNLPAENEARFVVAPNATAGDGTYELIYDTNLGRFVSVDDAFGAIVAQFQQTVGHVSGSPSMVTETFSSWGSGALSPAFVPTTLRTGDVRPFGLLGQGQVHLIHLYGEWMGAATLQATLTIDGVAQTAVDLTPKTLAAGATPNTRGQRWYCQFAPAADRCNSLDVQLTDVAVSAAITEGLVWLGCDIEVSGGPGGRRHSSGARA